MPNDVVKWGTDATSAEVTRLAIANRRCMIHLHNAVIGLLSAKPEDAERALAAYRANDKELVDIIWEIGGFDPHGGKPYA